MEEFAPDSEAFIKEAARRALSNSSLGYIAISDITEAAKFSSIEEENNLNSGEYRGVKTFAMTPGDSIGIIVVPNGTIQEVYNNPAISGEKKPLFSMATANSSDAFKPGQIAGVVNGGSIFVMEDMGIGAGSDADYNDIIFDLKGATPKIISLDDVIAGNSDWRKSDKGKELIAGGTPKTENKLAETTPADAKPENSPATETKNPTVLETPNSAADATEAKPTTSPEVETQNPTVSETPNSATDATEAKPTTSPAVETQNLTVSETPNSATDATEAKTANFPTLETENPVVLETPNGAINPVETEIDAITGDKIKTPVFLVPETSEIPTPAAAADILTGEIADTYPTLTDSLETDSFNLENLPPLSPEEISQLWETLNSNFSQQFPEIPPIEFSEYRPQPISEDAEYIIEKPTVNLEITVGEYVNSDRESENIAIDSEISIGDRNRSGNSQNIISENIIINSEIPAKDNSQPDNSQNLITDSETKTETDNDFAIDRTETQPEITSDSPQQNQQFIGIIDTGFTATNPNIDRSQIILGKDAIDGDSNPLIQADKVKQHGDAILEIIADSDNPSNTEKSNRIWLGRATGSGNWHQSLIEFVDAAKNAKQANAVVNLSFDLTGINPDWSLD